ncbi:UvrD-helicase domain-containing protein [Alkaliphilus oremlandii]|uniref:DNA 3'-5' helicase n=1 Tax=Alkaliphilus oremlandii (strain OhILAs) TaxID=350688 RepID=A8MID8_ALKOO|nr:UvrD-helicase domain-containing protein [Alkaliphilus oremlandii]ABW19570.1 hypothetical protein Clos_2033 [Alkaliphilus oremlandii OhILAs]
MKDSNITIKSNIYPRNGELFNDKVFSRQVKDRIALTKLIKLANLNPERDLTPIQLNLYKNELVKCSYNEEGDFTWGMLSRESEEVWGCRCEKVDCKRFSGCRSDLSHEDVKALKAKIESFISIQRLEDEDAYAEISKPATLIENKNIVDKQIESIDKTNIDEKAYEKLKDENDKLTKINEDIPTPVERVSISSQENEIKREILEDKQEDVIVADPTTKILVNAGPGTGKTYTLIERIKYLTLEEGINPENMMILSFSKAAIGEIHKRLSKDIEDDVSYWDLNLVDIRTFDSFATYVMKAIDQDYDLSGKGYEERIELCIEEIKKHSDIFSSIEHVIVDEIQDLVGVRARLVQTILEHVDCGFTLLGDLCQSIYDHQVKDQLDEIDSEKFNKWLRLKYKDEIKEYEFINNHRQIKELAEETLNIRKSILMDTEEEQERALLSSIERFPILSEYKKIRNSMEESNLKNACFLCRTNGQALKVSSYLHDQEIYHKVQRPSNFKLLKPWLGKVFSLFEKVIIDYDEFEVAINKLNLEETLDIKAVWEELKTIEAQRASHLNIEDFVLNLSTKKHLFDSLCIQGVSNFTVSTIHRAKGREFDQVVLLNDDILSYKEENGIRNEIKTYYVAVTRPKFKIYRSTFGEKALYMRKVNTASNRWVETQRHRFTKKVFIQNIEVGKEYDIDATSFINENILSPYNSPKENQEYLLNNVKSGEPVVLKKQVIDNDVYYYIYHDDHVIGSMSLQFTEDIYRTYKKINRIPTRDITKFPNEIRKVYIDEVCTYIKEGNTELPNEYSRKGLWLGVSLVGLGKIERY